MSDTHKDREFLDMADAFIAVANRYAQEVDKGRVSAAFLYAAARFNTFIVASSAPNVAEFTGYQDKAMQYFADEYQKMLVEHFADYSQNFSTYTRTVFGGSVN